jgi:hypothetical protein
MKNNYSMRFYVNLLSANLTLATTSSIPDITNFGSMFYCYHAFNKHVATYYHQPKLN